MQSRRRARERRFCGEGGADEEAVGTVADEIGSGASSDAAKAGGREAFEEAAALSDREGATDYTMRHGRDRLPRDTGCIADGLQEVADLGPDVHR